MRKKVRRSLALLLAFAMMVTLVKSDELFVSAESSSTLEQVSSVTDETQEEIPADVPEEGEAGVLAETDMEPGDDALLEAEDTLSEEDAKPADEVLTENDAKPSDEALPENDAEPSDEVLPENDTEPSDEVSSENDAEPSDEVLTENGAEPSDEVVSENDAKSSDGVLPENDTESADDVMTEDGEEPESILLEYVPEEQPEGITVKAYAEEGVLPEKAVMVVTALLEDGETADKYSVAAKTLTDSGVEYDGFLAFDIGFQDEDGNEIEPEDGTVQVKFEMDTELLPEYADAETLSVQHLAETEEGIKAETVADTADAAEGTVEVKEDGTGVEAEFEVESFSIFALTYSADLQARAALTNVETVDSKSLGVTINAFNYNGENDYKGINAGKRFKFTGGEKRQDRELLNVWTGDESIKGRLLQGILSSTLKDGFPVLSAVYGGESLAYLFDDTKQTGKQSYTDLNHLFLKDVYDKEKYFEYDSSKNFATLVDDTDKNFTVYNSAATTQGQFMPFNDMYGNGQLVGNADYHFGLNVSFDFIQPQNGLVDGKPMRFEFTGDDDLWVFVDDVLVLDMGGIHSAYSGYIDFQTGTVVADDGGANSTTTLSKALTENGVDSGLLEENTLKNYTQHNVKIFYLERGAGGSNCRMRFNIPPVPDGVVYVGKQISNDSNSPEFADSDFNFKAQIRKWDASKNSYESYTDYVGSYKVYEGTAGDTENAKYVEEKETSNGEFTLKHNQFAVLQDDITNADQYRVMEYEPDFSDINAKYDIVVGSVEAESIDVDGKQNAYMGREDLPVGSNHVVVFTNKCQVKNLYNLQIIKELESGSSDEEFNMQVTLGGKLYTGDYYVAGKGAAEIGEKKTSSTGNLSLKAGEKITIQGVVWGSSFEIIEKEYNEDSYDSPTYKIDNAVEGYDISGKASGTIPTTVQENKVTAVTVTNHPKNNDLTIRKNVSGIDASLVNDIIFTFEINGNKTLNGTYVLDCSDSGDLPDEGNASTVTFKNGKAEIEIKGVNSVTIKGLPLGDYTVKEVRQSVEPKGYYFSTQAEDLEKSAQVTSSASAEITITNCYEKTKTVTVTKIVDGNMGDYDGTYTFTVKVNDELVHEFPDITSNDDGTIELGHKGSISLTGLHKGDRVEISEKDYSAQGYTTFVAVDDNPAKEGYSWSTEDSGIQNDVKLTFTNTKNVDPPTGIFHETVPYMIMLAISVLGVGLFLISRRRRV